MAWDWSNKTGLQEHIEANFQESWEHYFLCLTELGHANDSIPDVDDPDARTVMGYLKDAIGEANLGMALLTVHKSGFDPPFGIPYYLKTFTIAEAPDPDEYELTWKKIIMAWSEISDAARMWTITSIDQMRQSIWNKPTKIKWTENPFE